MSAEKLSDRCATEEAICVDLEGKLWPDDYIGPTGKPLHCMDCHLQCPEDPPAPSPDDNICNSNLTAIVMWMSGFKMLEVGEGQPCIAYGFDWFVLDSPAKFVTGVIITLVGGIAVECIVFARRQILARPLKLHSRSVRILVHSGLVVVYGLQVMLGYLLMLVAMTYQVELFLAVVVGLTAGHAIFNAKGPVLDSSDACCMGLDAWTPHEDDPPDALQRRVLVPEGDLNNDLYGALLANQHDCPCENNHTHC